MRRRTPSINGREPLRYDGWDEVELWGKRSVQASTRALPKSERVSGAILALNLARNLMRNVYYNQLRSVKYAWYASRFSSKSPANNHLAAIIKMIKTASVFREESFVGREDAIQNAWYAPLTTMCVTCQN